MTRGSRKYLEIMKQLSLNLDSAMPTGDDGWPHKDGRWIMRSYCAKPGYAPGEWPHLTFKSAVKRALILLNESPAFYSSIEVYYKE
jgi:hypothetical protein